MKFLVGDRVHSKPEPLLGKPAKLYVVVDAFEREGKPLYNLLDPFTKEKVNDVPEENLEKAKTLTMGEIYSAWHEEFSKLWISPPREEYDALERVVRWLPTQEEAIAVVRKAAREMIEKLGPLPKPKFKDGQKVAFTEDEREHRGTVRAGRDPKLPVLYGPWYDLKGKVWNYDILGDDGIVYGNIPEGDIRETEVDREEAERLMGEIREMGKTLGITEKRSSDGKAR